MKERIRALDGLRGICALMVTFSHALKYIDIDNVRNIEEITLLHVYNFQVIITKLLLSLSNATGAVFIFFILSSYVLVLSWERVSEYHQSLMVFYLRRFLRLAPAYFFSIFVISLFLLFVTRYNIHSVSSFFSSFYTFHLSTKILFANLFLLQASFNPIAWTLQVELLGSLFLPFFYFFSFKTPKVIHLIFFLLLIGLSIAFRGTNPLHYLYIFYLGLILKKAKFFFSFFQNNRGAYILIWILAFCLFTLPRGILLPSSTIISQLCEVFGCWLMVGLILYTNGSFISAFLSSHIAQFYGKISYSFYLLNFVVTFALVNLMSSRILPVILLRYGLYINLTTAIASIGVTTVLAMWSYQFIEQPFIKISSKIARMQKKETNNISKEW